MCGFAAYVGPGAPSHAHEVRNLSERIAHRGPDDTGTHESARAALAHRRLSIIDVAGGKQPLTDDDGGVLVCNGEIYNHASLRADLENRHRFRTRSDSESILHLYREKGAACVGELDGMFAFVVADGARFLAARDPLGIKPLYALKDGAGIWLASELKALPAAGRDLTEFPPGSFLTEDGVVRRWFLPAWTRPPTKPVAPDPAVLAGKVEAAVVKRLMSDVPLGVFLSGGLDSSIIAGLVRRHVGGRLHSFSVGLAGAPDLPAARLVADHIGTTHHEYVYTPAEATRAIENVILHLESYDPALIRSAVPTYFLSKLTAQHVKVVLSGEGSDEVFAGYRYMAEIQDPVALHQECVRLLLGLHNMNLQRVDRMTMAHALEGRVPFLDVEFLAWAMAIDPAEKVQRADRPEKFLLRSAFETLLPKEIVWRKKEEFAAGCGSEPILAEFGEESVSDADFRRAAERFPFDTPTSKEAFLYRRIFEEVFPGDAPRRTVGRWLAAAPGP